MSKELEEKLANADDGFLKKYLDAQFAEKDETLTKAELEKKLLLLMQSKGKVAPPDVKNKMQKNIEVR